MTGVRRALTATAAVAVLALCAACSGDARSADPKPSSSAAPGAPGTTAAPTDRGEPLGPAARAATAGRPRARRHPRRRRRRAGPGHGRGGREAEGRHGHAVLARRAGDRERGADRGRGRPGAPTGASRRRSTPTSRTPGTASPAVSSPSRSGSRTSCTTDADGYLRLGGATDAPSVHVGAYVQQQPLIDAVVNPTWVRDPRHDRRQRAAGPHRRDAPAEGGEEAREALRRLRLGHARRQGHPHRARSRAPRRSRS